MTTETPPVTDSFTESQADARTVDADFIRGLRHLLDQVADDTLPEAERKAAADSVQEHVQELHVADQADIIDMLPIDHREALLDILKKEFDPQIFAHLESDAEDIMEYLGWEHAAKALSGLEADEAADVLEGFDEEDQQHILDAVPKAFREQVEEGLSYPESSAGRLMRKKIVLIPEYWTVGNAIDYLRKQDNLPEEFYSIFVVDPRNRPVGLVLLSKMIRSQRGAAIRDLMQPEVRLIPVDMDQEDAAHIFRKYGLVSAPVVNAENRVLGIITLDDVAHVLEEEADEDILRMGGVVERDFYAALAETVRSRFPWLFVNLLTAILASLVIGAFEETITQVVALAVLMPIVASMGGNAGTQSMTVAVRAIATRELNDANAARAAWKELLVGSVNGLMFAIVAFAVVMLWYQDIVLASIFAAATVLTLTVAGLAGALIPLTLSRFNMDPAVSSGVFLTTVTDVVGFFAFLGIAAWLL